MSMEHKIREHLHKKAEMLECPPAITKRIEQSYDQYLQGQRREITMKKRLISGVVAAAFLIPTAVFAAPPLIDLLTRTPMTAEQVKVDEVGKVALEKLYKAYPETKSFEIIGSTVQGVQTSVTLQEKGEAGKKITIQTNGTKGEIDDLTQENWEPKEKALNTLTEKEIKGKVDSLIHKVYGSIEGYEGSIEKMDNPNNKTWILNYTKQGADSYQAFVHDNTISLSRFEPEPATAFTKVEGFFSQNGKPDPTGDNFLNDEKLFALLNMTPQELKQELAKGKSVVEVAASKNVSKQQVIDVIAYTQVLSQLNGEVPKDEAVLKAMLKQIEPKVTHIIEHKTETPW